MIIDAHAHAARQYATVESLKAMAGRYDLEKIVLCTSPRNNLDLKAPPNYPFLKSPDGIFLLNRMLRLGYKSFPDRGDGNQYVADLRARLPDLVIQFLWVAPLDPGHMQGLERRVREYRVKGLKLHQAWNPFSIAGDEFARLVEFATANGLPIFIHLYSRREAVLLLHFMEDHRDAKFIVGHMLALDVFKEKPRTLSNLFFDTSGSERVRGRDIREAIDRFGDDHVIFGTDTPYAPIEDQIRKIDELRLGEAAKEKIFRSNIASLLSL